MRMFNENSKKDMREVQWSETWTDRLFSCVSMPEFLVANKNKSTIRILFLTHKYLMVHVTDVCFQWCLAEYLEGQWGLVMLTLKARQFQSPCNKWSFPKDSCSISLGMLGHMLHHKFWQIRLERPSTPVNYSLDLRFLMVPSIPKVQKRYCPWN